MSENPCGKSWPTGKVVDFYRVATGQGSQGKNGESKIGQGS